MFFLAFTNFEIFSQLLIQIFGTAPDGGVSIAQVGGSQLSLSLEQLRIWLGAGVVFSELVIVVLSVFDKIVDALKAVIKPLFILLPLVVFVDRFIKIFGPIIRSFLPASLGGGGAIEIASTVNSPNFETNVWATLGAMVFFLIMARIFGGDSREIERLRREIRRLREQTPNTKKGGLFR